MSVNPILLSIASILFCNVTSVFCLFNISPARPLCVELSCVSKDSMADFIVSSLSMKKVLKKFDNVPSAASNPTDSLIISTSDCDAFVSIRPSAAVKSVLRPFMSPSAAVKSVLRPFMSPSF